MLQNAGPESLLLSGTTNPVEPVVPFTVASTLKDVSHGAGLQSLDNTDNVPSSQYKVMLPM